MSRASGNHNETWSVRAMPARGSEYPRDLTLSPERVSGRGVFGVVYKALLHETNEVVAVKRIVVDTRTKSRELAIMRAIQHPNITKLMYFYYTSAREGCVLNLVMEFMPATLKRVATPDLPLILTKVFMYQLFRSLAYIHASQICHRDIKMDNLLVDLNTGVLKLCDFGCAKPIIEGEYNHFYICSRYFRAPELIFKSTQYTVNSDIWSAGCVMAQLFRGKPLFHGRNTRMQLVEILKVLGVPSQEELLEMNPSYRSNPLPIPPLRKLTWSDVLPITIPIDAILLINSLLRYSPSRRILPIQSCAHRFFDDLRVPGVKLPNGRPLPPLFNFNDSELPLSSPLYEKLIPSYIRDGGSAARVPPTYAAAVAPRGSRAVRYNSGTI